MCHNERVLCLGALSFGWMGGDGLDRSFGALSHGPSLWFEPELFVRGVTADGASEIERVGECFPSGSFVDPAWSYALSLTVDIKVSVPIARKHGAWMHQVDPESVQNHGQCFEDIKVPLMEDNSVAEAVAFSGVKH